MALSTAALNSLGDHLASLATHVSLHTAAPDGTGSNESTAARQTASWSATASGVLSLSVAENFTGGAASGACTWIGLWSLATGGTFYGSFQITTGDVTFNAAGDYTLDDINITFS